MILADTQTKAFVVSDELSRKVIGEAMHVHRILGPGFPELVYHNSLLIRLKKAGLFVESKKPLPVFFEGEIVGTFETDIIVERRLLLELKAVSSLMEAHEVQLVNYLSGTKIEVGLLLNFGAGSLQIKRRTFGYRPPIVGEDSPDYSPSSESSESSNPI